MKKNNLLQGAIVALLVASPLVAYAGQYPAADFEPKVLYQDASVKSDSAASVVAPTVAKSAPVVTDNSKYPAADFEPKILFKDEAYKPSKSAPSITSTTAEYTTSAGAVVIEQSKSEKESGNANLLILLALAGAVGFVAFNKRNKSTGSDDSVYGNRETGVTRYLNARVPKVSGVTKYLERNVKPTNVARYIAKQNIAQKAAQNDDNRG